jgi:serine/threonine protein kinase
MKTMDKRNLYKLRSIETVKMEMKILSQIIHPFIINMHYAFHDQNNAYMVSEYLKGGDLRTHLNKERLQYNEK